MLCDGRMVCGCADPYGRRVLGDARSGPVHDIWAGERITSLRGDLNNGGSTFETEATFVLGEVIDRSTIDGLTRAQRSGDPAKRAEAARLARDQVARRLDSLKKKRAQIEARAKQLRAKH